jgi:hypothetical protein
VTREQAIDSFRRGLAAGARRLARGPLRSVADVYIPFRVYVATLGRGVRREVAVLGVDAVSGGLDVYRFDRVPEAAEVVQVSTRNYLAPTLSTNTARDLLASRMRRLTYQRAGFLAGPFEFDAEPIDAVLHVPYWAGFFGRSEAASIVVMDAVRRQIEGAKVKRLIREWINSDSPRHCVAGLR